MFNNSCAFRYHVLLIQQHYGNQQSCWHELFSTVQIDVCSGRLKATSTCECDSELVDTKTLRSPHHLFQWPAWLWTTFLDSCTAACGMIGYWHNTVVCLSVSWQRLWSYDLTALYKSIIIIFLLLLLLLLLFFYFFYFIFYYQLLLLLLLLLLKCIVTTG